jgi:diguanylate cyclase (GGDEF)-like protein
LLSGALSCAPIGLLALRRARPRSHWCAYLNFSIPFAFSLFGYLTGRQADQLSTLSETDPLTGLHNARGLWKRLQEEVARAKRYHAPLTLFFVDLDRLKRINDFYGHRAGDCALCQLAEAIRSQLRTTDLAARWGGDEFAIVAPNTSEASARTLAERMRALAAERVSPWHGTASVGVATVDPGNGDGDFQIDGLIQAVDVALYEAKQRGRNCVVVGGLNPEAHMDGKIAELNSLFGELERSLIEQFLRARGCDPARLTELTDAERSRLLSQASVFASGRMAEVESRSNFVGQFHDGTPAVATRDR